MKKALKSVIITGISALIAAVVFLAISAHRKNMV